MTGDRCAPLLCEALLFDLDGVLVDSTELVERTWREWATRQGLDTTVVVNSAHGRRPLDTVRMVAPHLNATTETIALSNEEATATRGLVEVPGAHSLLAGLAPQLWAVVTSGDRAVAEHRLRYLGLPIPTIMVCGDEVTRGKPDPEGYLAAAGKLGIKPEACVVVEDAPSGIAAARNAGMRVIGLATTHSPDKLAGADAVADSLSALIVTLRNPEGTKRSQLEVRLRI